jgi:hypothetical protein
MNAMNADWVSDILDDLLAEIIKAETQFVAYLIMDHTRHVDAAGLCQALKPRCKVDPVPEDVVAVADYITDVDPDPELYTAFGWGAGIACCHAALDVDGAAHGVYNAYEFYKHSVAGCLDDPAPMFGDLRIDQLFTMAFELVESTLLVGTHKPTITGNVSCHDGGELTVDALFSHGVSPLLRARVNARRCINHRTCYARSNSGQWQLSCNPFSDLAI